MIKGQISELIIKSKTKSQVKKTQISAKSQLQCSFFSKTFYYSVIFSKCYSFVLIFIMNVEHAAPMVLSHIFLYSISFHCYSFFRSLSLKIQCTAPMVLSQVP